MNNKGRKGLGKGGAKSYFQTQNSYSYVVYELKRQDRILYGFDGFINKK